MYGGGGANKPLTNSLTTSNTLKNSNPKELSKNLNKIQSSNLSKESNSKIQDSIKLESIKDSNSIQSKQSKTTITKIGISIVASIVLSQSLVALPSGGKFTHGSGSIKVNGKEMNITGNNTNHIIAWGGGFNIGKDAEVNFNTSHGRQASFLNLDYTNKASQILGNLNGNGNNIYLVNPSGVLIGQNANINANKFVASNIIDDTTLNSFKNKINDTNAITTFSPVFKPNKGNIVNLGTIKANNGITLIGDTIDIRGGKIENTKGGTNKDNSIYFVGENIYIDADAVNLSSNNNIYATAFKEGYIQRQMKNFQKDSFKFGNFNQLITNESYAYNDNGDKSGQSNFKKVITLGNGNADEALSEWYWFANGWNNNGDTRSVDEFRLVGNIDFSKQIGGRDRYIIDFSKNENDIDRSFMYSGNYYDPNNDSNHNDNMAVGKDSANAFQGIFDGGGNTLSNVDIDYANSNYANYIGVFGYASNSTISNLNLDKVNIAAKKEVKKSASGESIGSLLGYGENLKISNIFVKDVNISFSVGSYTADLVQDKIGGFIGDIKNSTLDQIILDGFNINTTSEAGLALIWAGGFFGRSIGVNASNVAIQGNNNNIKVNMFNWGGIVTPGTPPSIYLGGFAGLSQDGNLKNISIEVDTISGEGQNLQHAVIGGFAGWGHQINGDNINLNIKSLFGKIKGRTQQGSGNNQGLFMGGFGGKITSSDISNISINNIEEIVGENTLKTSDSFNLDSDKTYIGGFAGNMQQSGNKISNVVLNNIGKLSGVSQYDNVYIAGFVGSNDFSNVSFNNIYLYFNPNSTILAEANNGTAYKGKFYGSFNNFNPSLSNIHLYYKDGTLNGINSDSKDYHSISNPNGQIFLNPYANETQGKEIFKQALEKQNNLGGAFESNKIVNIGDDSNPIYSFEQTTSSDITPPTDSNTPDINWGNVVLEGSDFSVSILQEIINDILNGKYGINIDNREVLSNLAESLNNANTLQDYFNAINSYLISSSLDESTKESIRQSMDFLVAFYGENGLGDKFKGDTNYKDFYDKSFYISTSLKDLGNFISGDLNGGLDSVIVNIKALESLKQRIKAAQKYYQEALEAKLPYETLEGIYNGMVKTINESYIQALGVLETLKGEDRDYLIRLYKEYSIKEDSGFDDIRGTFSFSGNDILSKIDSIILEDKPALTPPTKEEVGDDPTKENNPNIPNNLQKIADLASKEAILILPAQEKQEAIVEDGKERGRLCIVSDNAKTNNPCMAITY